MKGFSFVYLITGMWNSINYSHCGAARTHPCIIVLLPLQMSNSRLRRIRTFDGEIFVAPKVGGGGGGE